jgi:amino acid adenylation domain-containing protein
MADLSVYIPGGDWNKSSHDRQIPIEIPPDAKVDISSLLAAVAALLYRYSGNTAVTLNLEHRSGDPNGSSSPHQETTEVDLSRDPCFSALVAQLSRLSSRSEHEVIRCRVPSDLSRWLARVGASPTENDLSFCIVREGDTAQAWVGYTSEIFDGHTVTRLAIHFGTLLEAALSQLDEPISLLPMMSQNELNQTLVEWNGSGCDIERPTLFDAFEERVRKDPKAPALLYNGQTISYRELQLRALKVASYLQASSIGWETRIGVYLEDPIAVVVSYLGIVSAGGVIVPLDLDWPEERLASVIATAEIRSVIVSGNRRPPFALPKEHLLEFETLEAASMAKAFQRPAISANSAAYVIFTSGSTGTPKAIVGLHRSISAATIVAKPFRKNEVFSLNANLTFGSALIGVFFALLGGAAISLVPRSIAKDLPAMVRFWELMTVTRIVLVPPQVRQLLALGEEMKARLRDVTNITLAGSALTPELTSGLYEWFPRATVVNAYTCLEVGTVITRWEAGPEERERPLTIGRPVPNVKVYILGPQLMLLPPGMSGEIYVHSPDMAREYLNQPELTRERFLPNPFGSGGRLYRTGDIGRFLPSGELEYLGRVDNQVKIRGIRVELEEIEAALQKLPGVDQAAVIAAPRDGESRMIAFLSGKGGTSLSTRFLREQLGASLPQYLVPTLFVLMDRIPLTPNGKVDKQTLPKQVASRPETDTCYIAPRTAQEAFIVSIWEQELGIEGIGVDDHFLEIGGDSLLAVRIARRLEQEFLCEIPIEALFKYPTVGELSAELRRMHVTLLNNPLQLEEQRKSFS